MLRMSSTEPGPGEDLWEQRRLEWERQREMRELNGMSPEPEPTAREVQLQIGAGHELDDLNAIEPLEESKRIAIQIQHVSAHVPLLLQQPSLLKKLNPLALKRKISQIGTPKPTQRQVLFDVSGSVQPGEVLALMGPSGSGKTSLLSIMGKRAQKMMKVSGGGVLFNGHTLTKRLKRQVGYVMQDDLLYENLTVHETLYYAAMLRLPRHMPHADKLRRIEVIITALGLQTCRGTIIGGFFRKGISGGERKRTSIGVELLINPSVLMLDEPTSGLDSTTSMHVLSMLRHLAQGGRTIVTTIHQPSSRLYQQLDKLLLLSQGHAMYYGAAQAAADWFNSLGYRLPYAVSLADFILDLASADVATPTRDGEASRLYLIEQAEQYLAHHPQDGYQPASGAGDSSDQEAFPAMSPAKHTTSGLQTVHLHGGAPLTPAGSKPLPPSILWDSPGPASSSSGGGSTPSHTGGAADVALGIDGVQVERGETKGFAAPAPSAATSSVGVGREEHRWGAPYWTQVALLFRRSLRTRRFETLSNQDIAQFFIIAVLAGLFWLQTGKDNTVLGARNTMGLLFFLLMFLSFRALFVALFTFPDEYKHMLKERASGMYRLSAFYLARTLSDVPMDFATPTAFILIVYFMGGLRYNAAAFFGIYGVSLLAMLVAQSLGLLLGVITMVPKTAQTIASVVMMTIVLTGGFFVLDLPAWISWLRYLSYIFYALDLMMFIEFEGGSRQIYSCIDPAAAQNTCTPTNPGSPETDPNCTPVEDIQSALGLLQDPSSQGDAIVSAFVLLGFFIFFRALVYLVLRRKTARL